MKIKDESHILSFITNFGCHYKCNYCITKKAGINIPFTTMESLNGLSDKIKKSHNGLISISGVGDPLYNYENNKRFYECFFSITDKLKCGVEIHTSYINSSFNFEKCYRVVYHITGLDEIKEIEKIKRHGGEKTRIVFVIEPFYTENDIVNIYNKYVNNTYIDQLSFRQMVDENFKPDDTLKDYLEKGHIEKKWYYIKQADYNNYIVEENEFKKFREIK
jgi:organic radical activating enzyme